MGKAALDDREDWMVRWIAMHDRPSTSTVSEVRQQMDPEETSAKTATTLKKLEKAGFLSSEKDGRELRWTATKEGQEAMA